MIKEKASGVLLHPTSLPSRYGVGDLGQGAYDFVDFLIKGGQKLWQILPLNPPGFGESPYQCFSAFAGNPLLISLDLFIQEGLLLREEVVPPQFDQEQTDFEQVKVYKEKQFRKAFERFSKLEKDQSYFRFLEANEDWLLDYGFFMALKEYFKGIAWNYWEPSIAFRKADAINFYQNLLKDEIQYQFFLQYKFYQQWSQLRNYANRNHIRIIGDLPIFISYDSSDAWVAPHLFELDEKGNPLLVAGVPPDYFSRTGQLWGNPHFNWKQMESDNFLWWRRRIKKLMEQVDIIRIDHFRGFEAYWEIPATAKTAETGRWVKAPGDKLFTTIHKELGEVPIIAEDLGFITPEVKNLKKKFAFPGMKILQFSFYEKNPRNEKPEGFEKQSVVYTGTHDNETILGWYKSLVSNQSEATLLYLKKYYQITESLTEEEICWKLIEIAFKSNSIFAIIPLQDILCIDNRARMNYPGTIGGNWQWRYKTEDLTTEAASKLMALTIKYRS